MRRIHSVFIISHYTKCNNPRFVYTQDWFSTEFSRNSVDNSVESVKNPLSVWISVFHSFSHGLRLCKQSSFSDALSPLYFVTFCKLFVEPRKKALYPVRKRPYIWCFSNFPKFIALGNQSWRCTFHPCGIRGKNAGWFPKSGCIFLWNRVKWRKAQGLPTRNCGFPPYRP